MVDHVRQRLVELAVAENYISDQAVAEACAHLWAEGEREDALVGELWVEGTYPGEKADDTLDSLAASGFFPRDLLEHIARSGVFRTDQRLYNHQSEAIRAAAHTNRTCKPALVITAGTGLGKTEAFLLPVLRDLWNAPDRCENGGMRCLILYPMNALVADQIDRIYRWLQGQTRLTVFHFTSETPEDTRAANGLAEELWQPCRMRTRQEARGLEGHDGRAITQPPFGRVPDIVITNYSMLEYMLCRPQDKHFFGSDLRCIILDEAHLYTGALAAEIAMLLRRVRDRCGVASQSILHMATSATLGGSDADLRDFASELFSTEKESTLVIRGRYEVVELASAPSAPGSADQASSLAAHADMNISTVTSENQLVTSDTVTVDKLIEVLKGVAPASDLTEAKDQHSGTTARFLRHVLERTPLARRIAQTLSSGAGHVLSLDALAQALFSGMDRAAARKATILLLRLSAAARDSADEMPLIPHRLHFLVRAPEGLSMCLNPECSGPSQTRVPPLGSLQRPNDWCRHCGHVALPLHRCANCGKWAFAGHVNLDILEPGNYAEKSSQRTFYLVANPQGENLREFVVDSTSGKIRGHGAEGVTLWKAPLVSSGSSTQCCPNCRSPWTPASDDDLFAVRRQPCKPIIGGRPFALSVIGETVLHDLPPLADASSSWKPAGGRRLLCFSDSRRSAADLGPRLTRQHEINVTRSAIARCASQLSTEAVAVDLKQEIAELEGKLREPALSPERRQRYAVELERKSRDLSRSEAGASFEDFCALVSQRAEIRELLNRDSGEKHQARSYDQREWESNAKATIACAQGLVASEFDRPLRTAVSVEAVGLVELAYPGVERLAIPQALEAELARDARAKVNSSWCGILCLLLDSLRADHCLGWSTETDGRRWMGESPLTGRWATRTRGGWAARAFVGATARQQRRRFAREVLRTARIGGCSERDLDRLSELLLCSAFDQLYSAAAEGRFAWLDPKEIHQTGPNETDRAIRILLDGLAVRKPQKLYRCAQTGTVWAHSALGWTWIDGCRGNLQAVTPQVLDADPRWGRARRELHGSPIFSMGLWAEEHSAQRSPRENRRLQDLFKAGIRNVLSSTTTMELGVDIGGLNGVLLSNVPPGPANHRQRAGRAGRRSDGSAVVVTFARGTEFDREVFQDFGKFITRELRKPVVFMDRRKIIERHIRAVLFSEFFRGRQPERTGTMPAFGHMGPFCSESCPQFWSGRIVSKPVWSPRVTGLADQFGEFLCECSVGAGPIQQRLSRLCESTPLSNIASNEEWPGFLAETRESFEQAIEAWRQDIQQLRDSWDEIPAQPTAQRGWEMAKANSIRWQVQTLCDITVIEWLADHRFLPRYGFPINLQKLKVRSPDGREQSGRQYGHKQSERYRLERDSLLALSEYVPGSHVLVGGKVVISRGISKHWTESNYNRALGLQTLALECQYGHVYTSLNCNESCPTCGCSARTVQQLIFPRFGYTTAAWEVPGWETEFERVGEGKVCPTSFAEGGAGEMMADFAGLQGLKVTYREEAPLLIRNAGDKSCGFAICTRCGFAESEEDYGNGVMKLPREFAQHASVFSSNPDSFCWTRNEVSPPVLRNRVIAAQELTDMLLLDWPEASIHNANAVYSLGRALVIAGARLLELDARELNMELLPLKYPKLGIVVLDNTRGGAGHCLELMRLGREWLDQARAILFVSNEHHQRCRRACLDCILDFSGQHKARMLDRRAALDLLDRVGR
jgi:Lhr-like helicase